MHKVICKISSAAFLSFIIFITQPVYSEDESLEKAKQFNQKASVLTSSGHYAEAIPFAKRALEIWERVLGPEHHHVVAGLNNLAELYRELGEYAKAEPLYNRALAISEKLFGPDHANVASLLSNLSILYYSRGDYEKARSFQKRALAIKEEAFGPDHPGVAVSLGALAGIYQELALWEEAERLYKIALTIREEAFGTTHRDVAITLTNLAELYKRLGDYDKAEPLFKRALAIMEKTLGPEHHVVAISLHNLAQLYDSMGDYTKAESLCKRALAISEKTFGLEHPQVAACADTLGTIYENYGDFAKAALLYKRSLLIREKFLGPKHPDVASSLNNLGIIYGLLGKNNEAVSLIKKAITIFEETLGPEHPLVATSLNNLAEAYIDLGEYTKAEPLFKRSLALLETSLGKENPKVSACLNNLALLYGAMDDFQKSHAFNSLAQDIDSTLIDQAMAMKFTSEDQKIKFLLKKRGNLYSYISCINQNLSQSESAKKDALDVWLKRKGIILEAQKRYQEALVYSDDPEAVKTFQELAEIRARLSRLVFGGLEGESVEEYKNQITALEAQKEKLEARLSKLSQAFATHEKKLKADSDQVASVLPKDTILLEFARIKIFNFKAKRYEEKWRPAHYIAFLLHAGNEDRVGMIDLGDAEKIDMAVALFKKDLKKSVDKGPGSFMEASRKLHDLVFEPLKKALGEVREIYISPDGNLNLIPFEVLQGPDGRFLIEDYTFNYLAAGRDVLGFGEIKEQGGKALLMGDPDFDMGTGEKKSVLKRIALIEGKDKDFAKRSSDMRGLYFARLPGTRKEVDEIHDIIGRNESEIYTGKMALEEVLMNKGTPRILHLATHGFFLNDLDLSALRDDSPGRGINEVSIIPKSAPLKKIKIENPLLRSGIALAGANKTLDSSDMEKNDGIVTAEKILGMRLRGTDMVVLSACDTGVGEVKAGEGVFGLRRAFTQTGAKSLVMSMWSVPDRETKELMVEFYKNIQSGKMNRCQALRQAALKQMEIVKERYGNANPYYWGAFVFVGEP